MIRNIRTQSDYKKTLVRNQLTSLVLYESITTTNRKAKALVSFANRFFYRTKVKDLSSIRYAQAILFDPNALKKVFEEIAPRYPSDATTFVRSYKTSPRKGDSAEQVIVSLLKPLQVEPDKAETEKAGSEKIDKVAADKTAADLAQKTAKPIKKKTKSDE